ncbi:MAG: asparagine--tRNA ligase [Bacteroidales bacterium]|nr:asparagine--tRNA ligase [Bacteroidales bacterium]MCF8343907.1 asparagine--tRNA ligase [Bacteroidales bacterium]MCF8351316.1 asparagine--tRNA ligase [Bacteroidales bacterium]MCF8376904.1 asparagine--tRNA ligase [Bacteroidales bacterium]MCF8400827.1 asparagine--tRNA ligase [Bacteroidales bacterium]
MKRTEIKSLLQTNEFNGMVNVKGWVRTKRGSKNVAFIALNDGSTIHNVQIVVDVNQFDVKKLEKVTTGAAISVNGQLVQSKGKGQTVEIIAEELEMLGEADPNKYPLQPKKHSLEFLREIAHLRFRTNTFGAITRLRHAMIFAVHKFFTERGFYNIHSPIITGSDAEGAGEMFRVSVLDPKNPPLKEDGSIDFKKDFFGKETNLTVSGQLEAELAALALSKVYTFGPTFRAENSNTPRHLAEFWMIEPEVAFNDIHDNMDLAEEMLKYLVQYALDNCEDDLDFLSKRQQDAEKDKKQDERQMELIEKLNFVLAHDFERITYTRAIDILRNSKPNKKGKFVFPVKEWGMDLQSEHERYLVEKEFKKPVIITDYPKKIKAFYMKQNDDGNTVRGMDVLFPQIGEIIGGSQREEVYDKLYARIKEMNIEEKTLWWYLDTRRFGTVPHSGYGLGFERLMIFVSGMSNIRDVIPFPRTPQNAEF